MQVRPAFITGRQPPPFLLNLNLKPGRTIPNIVLNTTNNSTIRVRTLIILVPAHLRWLRRGIGHNIYHHHSNGLPQRHMGYLRWEFGVRRLLLLVAVGECSFHTVISFIIVIIPSPPSSISLRAAETPTTHYDLVSFLLLVLSSFQFIHYSCPHASFFHRYRTTRTHTIFHTRPICTQNNNLLTFNNASMNAAAGRSPCYQSFSSH